MHGTVDLQDLAGSDLVNPAVCLCLCLSGALSACLLLMSLPLSVIPRFWSFLSLLLFYMILFNHHFPSVSIFFPLRGSLSTFLVLFPFDSSLLQSALLIVAPALQTAVVKHCASVKESHANSLHSTARTLLGSFLQQHSCHTCVRFLRECPRQAASGEILAFSPPKQLG